MCVCFVFVCICLSDFLLFLSSSSLSSFSSLLFPNWITHFFYHSFHLLSPHTLSSSADRLSVCLVFRILLLPIIPQMLVFVCMLHVVYHTKNCVYVLCTASLVSAIKTHNHHVYFLFFSLFSHFSHSWSHTTHTCHIHRLVKTHTHDSDRVDRK